MGLLVFLEEDDLDISPNCLRAPGTKAVSKLKLRLSSNFHYRAIVHGYFCILTCIFVKLIQFFNNIMI